MVKYLVAVRNYGIWEFKSLKDAKGFIKGLKKYKKVEYSIAKAMK